jgi:hypothetical protein
MAGSRNMYFSGYDLARDLAPLGSLLPAGSELQRIYEETARRAMTVGDVLTMLRDFEVSMTAGARAAQAAAQKKILTQEDAKLYDVLATAQFGMELWLYNFLQRLFADAPVVARQIPRPVQLPTSAQLAGVMSRAQLPRAGLGALPALAWAAIVLGVLAAVAAGSLVYAFTSGDVAAEEARQAIAIGKLTKDEWDSMLAARERTYASCTAQGGTPDDCAEVARRLIPTPEEAGTVPQILLPQGRTVWTFVLPTLVLMGAAGAIYYFVSRRRGASPRDDSWGFEGLGGARRVKRLDGPSSYHLEVRKDAR